MANIKGMNVTGQKVTPNAYGIHERGKYTGSITGMNVTQNSTPNMSVMVAVGTAVLTKNTNSSVTAILDTPTNITIATASTANPRIDTLVVYEDLSVTMPTEEPYSIDAANGRFKIVSIAGTPGTSPVALDDTAIQSAIGGANTSWARICTVRVEKSTTTIIDSKIDNSVKLPLSSILALGAVGTNQIAPEAVTSDKIGTTWVSYTPTWTNGTIQSSSVVAKYMKIGKIVFVSISAVLKAGDSVGTNIQASLPVPSIKFGENNSSIGVFNYAYTDTGIAQYFGIFTPTNYTLDKVPFVVSTTGSTYMGSTDISATVPFTFGNGDALRAFGWYVAA